MAIIDLTIERPALKRVERPMPEHTHRGKTVTETERTDETTDEETETSGSGSSRGRSVARRVGTMAFLAGVLGGAFYLFRRRRTLREMASIEVDAPESDIEA